MQFKSNYCRILLYQMRGGERRVLAHLNGILQRITITPIMTSLLDFPMPIITHTHVIKSHFCTTYLGADVRFALYQ